MCTNTNSNGGNKTWGFDSSSDEILPAGYFCVYDDVTWGNWQAKVSRSSKENAEILTNYLNYNDKLVRRNTFGGVNIGSSGGRFQAINTFRRPASQARRFSIDIYPVSAADNERLIMGFSMAEIMPIIGAVLVVIVLCFVGAFFMMRKKRQGRD